MSHDNDVEKMVYAINSIPVLYGLIKIPDTPEVTIFLVQTDHRVSSLGRDKIVDSR